MYKATFPDLEKLLLLWVAIELKLPSCEKPIGIFEMKFWKNPSVQVEKIILKIVKYALIQRWFSLQSYSNHTAMQSSALLITRMRIWLQTKLDSVLLTFNIYLLIQQTASDRVFLCIDHISHTKPIKQIKSKFHSISFCKHNKYLLSIWQKIKSYRSSNNFLQWKSNATVLHVSYWQRLTYNVQSCTSCYFTLVLPVFIT